MASAQVVETSVTNNSPSQDSNHPDDLFQSRKDILLKIMQYCPGSGQGLLPALGVRQVCQDFKNFLMWKFPLLMINALLKSKTWL